MTLQPLHLVVNWSVFAIYICCFICSITTRFWGISCRKVYTDWEACWHRASSPKYTMLQFDINRRVYVYTRNLVNIQISFLFLGRIAAVARCSILMQTEQRGLSVCLSVGHGREPCKMAEPIEMWQPFGTDQHGQGRDPSTERDNFCGMTGHQKAF